MIVINTPQPTVAIVVVVAMTIAPPRGVVARPIARPR
jgi:hypothetical protein